MKTNKNVSYGWERSNSKGKNDGIKGKVWFQENQLNMHNKIKSSPQAWGLLIHYKRAHRDLGIRRFASLTLTWNITMSTVVVDRQMHWHMKEWLNSWMTALPGCLDRQVVDGWLDGWVVDGWTDGWMDRLEEWMDGWMNTRVHG
jgi:hypothetical protein